MTLTEALADYRQAQKILDNYTESSFTEQARHIVEDAKTHEWDYPIKCLICGQDARPIRATTAEIARWIGPPKGVCDECDKSAPVLIEYNS